jgi:cell division protein FtsZ
VTRPFAFEGKLRADQAEQGIQSLRGERRHAHRDRERPAPAGRRARHAGDRGVPDGDDILRQGVQGITDLITVPGSSTSTSRTCGRSCARPARRSWASASRAAATAPSRPRRRRSRPAPRDDDRRRDRHPAEHHGRPDLGLAEVDEARQVVTNAADSNANVIFGAVIDEAMGEDVRVTAIATGSARGRRRGAPRRRRRRRERAPVVRRPSVRDVEIDIPSFLKED